MVFSNQDFNAGFLNFYQNVQFCFVLNKTLYYSVRLGFLAKDQDYYFDDFWEGEVGGCGSGEKFV